MPPIEDHDLRYALANELHARPFPTLSAPSGAVFLAIKQPHDAVSRDRNADREHLIALLDLHGAPHPQPGATHWFGEIGNARLKWESHTEFVTYTLFVDHLEDRPFDAKAFDHFPADWLEKAPGVRVTSALVRIEHNNGAEHKGAQLGEWFVPESLAVSEILDGSAVIAGDFRIDPAGHMRFAVFMDPETGPRRTGRIVQRICEIETYKTMSMLGLARVRALGARMGELDQALSTTMAAMTSEDAKPEQTLQDLLRISSELEQMLAQSAFRFGATGAYAKLVQQRVEVLREARYEGRQSFAEFMQRRFEPAMRTVESAERRLAAMAERATRAGDLLRTRVDVERSEQNQKLLESMDERADLQLRLQRTVEGLSVVAISYYAVNLALYMAAPLGDVAGVSKILLSALLTPLVVLGVWWMVRRIRDGIEK